MASLIIGNLTVHSPICSGQQQRKLQTSTLVTLLSVKEVHWWLVDSPHSGPVMQKMLMSSWEPWKWVRHDDIMKWKHFPHYWPLCGKFTGHWWRGTLMFSLICAWINGWVNKSEAGDLRRPHAHYDVTVMEPCDWAAADLLDGQFAEGIKVCFAS